MNITISKFYFFLLLLLFFSCKRDKALSPEECVNTRKYLKGKVLLSTTSDSIYVLDSLSFTFIAPATLISQDGKTYSTIEKGINSYFLIKKNFNSHFSGSNESDYILYTQKGKIVKTTEYGRTYYRINYEPYSSDSIKAIVVFKPKIKGIYSFSVNAIEVFDFTNSNLFNLVNGCYRNGKIDEYDISNNNKHLDSTGIYIYQGIPPYYQYYIKVL